MNFHVSRRISLFTIAMVAAATFAVPTVAAAESDTPPAEETTTTTTTAVTETTTTAVPETTTSIPATTTTLAPTTTTLPAQDTAAAEEPAEASLLTEDTPAEEPPAEEEPVVELAPGGTFVDDNRLPEEGWIEAIAAIGVTKGCNPPDNTNFCPQGTVTRGQMAAFLARALDLPPTSTDYFVDDGETVYENDINRIAQAGITKGCNPPDNDRFCPDSQTTRGQMAAFLVRGFGLTGTPDLARFTDDDGSVFEADISLLEQAGITNGCGTASFCPNNPMQRKHMAVFLGRVLNLTPLVVPVAPEVIGAFTTYYDHCDDPCRVTNIQLIADTVDGTVVQPGEVFSVNDLVGIRTTAKGYVAAGAIIGGKIVCCDSTTNIGGGTSQFATTLYNASFFAALDDVYHRPHSIWFSRYPMGREATLGFPGPDVKFRNNTDDPLTIDTSYTDTSVTVEIIGINDVASVKSIRSGSATTKNGGYVKIKQIITYYDGTTETHTWSHTYNPIKFG